MQFLRTIFWVVLAVLGVLFATTNWKPVTINLWNGVVVDTYLPVLMLGTFLLGLVPMLILYRATKWRMNRRLESTTRALVETRPSEFSGTMPPGAAPLVPPPGVA